MGPTGVLPYNAFIFSERTSGNRCIQLAHRRRRPANWRPKWPRPGSFALDPFRAKRMGGKGQDF